MPDREKTISRLEEWMKSCPFAKCAHCKTKGKCINPIFEDAIALLKEQQARVMTLEEVKSLPDEADVFLEEVDCIVVAATISRQGEKWGMLPDATFFYGIESTSYESDEYYNGDYGRWWRCWTSRPSPEQMRETKWEGDSDA